MKPTEADIQAEMIEGWEILNGFNFGTKQGAGGWVDIRHTKTPLKVTFYENFKKIEFSDGLDDSGATIDAVNFLTGNYDLSSISQHYDPEEWQRIITMCKSIVRLITGEQVEQTLEEKVREILEPIGSRISDLKVSDQRVEFHAGVNRYSITSDTITREGYEFTLNEYKESRLNEDFRQCLPKVAAELSTRSTKPSYSDLEQRVDELEKGAIRYEERIVTHAGTIKTLEKDVERLERENASLLDKFGPIDQAEQQVAEVETRFQKLAKRAERIADLLIQLNEEIL